MQLGCIIERSTVQSKWPFSRHILAIFSLLIVSSLLEPRSLQRNLENDQQPFTHGHMTAYSLDIRTGSIIFGIGMFILVPPKLQPMTLRTKYNMERHLKIDPQLLNIWWRYSQAIPIRLQIFLLKRSSSSWKIFTHNLPTRYWRIISSTPHYHIQLQPQHS